MTKQMLVALVMVILHSLLMLSEHTDFLVVLGMLQPFLLHICVDTQLVFFRWTWMKEYDA